MKLRFLFSGTGGFISKTIQFFTRSRFSHTIPIVGKIGVHEVGLSADDLMVNLVSIETYKGGKYWCEIWETPFDLDQDTINRLMKYNKKHYGWFSLPWFIYRWFIRLFDKDWTGHNWNRAGAFCSEVSAMALEMNGVKLPCEINSIDPQEVLNLLVTIPGTHMIDSWDAVKKAKAVIETPPEGMQG